MNNHKTHKHCLLCNGSELAHIKGYSAIFLVRCQTCGFLFSENIPDEQFLSNHYKGYNRNQYISPITIKRYNQLLDGFEKFRSTNKIIDVGCGSGFFLEVAKKRGWSVFGTEFTDEAIEVCSKKGIVMKQGKLRYADFEAGSFDVATSFEVMEHINYPKEEVQAIHSLLRHGGIAYVTTPNFNSLSRLFLRSKWTVLEFPEHLCYYTPSTLKLLFDSCGFQDAKIVTTGISITRAAKSFKNTKEAVAPDATTDEKLRQSFESNTFMYGLKQAVNQLLTLSGTGDSIKATFRKS